MQVPSPAPSSSRPSSSRLSVSSARASEVSQRNGSVASDYTSKLSGRQVLDGGDGRSLGSGLAHDTGSRICGKQEQELGELRSVPELIDELQHMAESEPELRDVP